MMRSLRHSRKRDNDSQPTRGSSNKGRAGREPSRKVNRGGSGQRKGDTSRNSESSSQVLSLAHLPFLVPLILGGRVVQKKFRFGSPKFRY